MDEKTLRKVREKLDKALAANRNDEAIQLLATLVSAEPTNARWPHKRGDLLRRVGRTAEAVEAYSAAVDTYARTGFIARAVAMAKTVLSLDPSRIDVLSRVDPNAAQALHRQARPVSLLPAPLPAAADAPDALQPTAARHPMVLGEEVPEPAGVAKRHPMVLGEEVPESAGAAKRHPMVLDDDVAEPGLQPAVPPRGGAPLRPTAQGVAPPPLDATRSAAAPPPPPAAPTQRQPVLTLDRLSLPPARPQPPPPPAAAAAAADGSGSKPRAAPPPPRPPGSTPRAAPPPPRAPGARAVPPPPALRPPPSSGSVPGRPPPIPAAASRSTASGGSSPSQVSAPSRPRESLPEAPLWTERSPVGALPAVPGPDQPTRAPKRTIGYGPAADEADLFSRALEAALELAAAPDAAPNETRFSDAPPRPGAALSPAEVSPRLEAAPDETADAVPPSAGQLSHLPLLPLFAEVPQNVLEAMIEGTELIELGAGAYVMRRGDPGDALYGIVEGSVIVSVPNQSIELTLAEGDVFGESCLLQDEPRHADVRVQGRLTALRIPREVLFGALGHHPPLAELLLELLTRRLLGNLLQTSPLFHEFDAEGRSELSRLFEVRRAAEGTMLAVAGKRMDGLYISLTGTLLVEAPGKAPRVAPPGSMFGQHTLLSQDPAPSTVTARVNLIVLRLPSATFSQLAMQYPTVVERLAELSTGDVVSVNL